MVVGVGRWVSVWTVLALAAGLLVSPWSPVESHAAVFDAADDADDPDASPLDPWGSWSRDSTPEDPEHLTFNWDDNLHAVIHAYPHEILEYPGGSKRWRFEAESHGHWPNASITIGLTRCTVDGSWESGMDRTDYTFPTDPETNHPGGWGDPGTIYYQEVTCPASMPELAEARVRLATFYGGSGQDRTTRWTRDGDSPPGADEDGWNEGDAESDHPDAPDASPLDPWGTWDFRGNYYPSDLSDPDHLELNDEMHAVIVSHPHELLRHPDGSKRWRFEAKSHDHWPNASITTGGVRCSADGSHEWQTNEGTAATNTDTNRSGWGESGTVYWYEATCPSTHPEMSRASLRLSKFYGGSGNDRTIYWTRNGDTPPGADEAESPAPTVVLAGLGSEDLALIGPLLDGIEHELAEDGSLRVVATAAQLAGLAGAVCHWAETEIVKGRLSKGRRLGTLTSTQIGLTEACMVLAAAAGTVVPDSVSQVTPPPRDRPDGSEAVPGRGIGLEDAPGIQPEPVPDGDGSDDRGDWPSNALDGYCDDGEIPEDRSSPLDMSTDGLSDKGAEDLRTYARLVNSWLAKVGPRHSISTKAEGLKSLARRAAEDAKQTAELVDSPFVGEPGHVPDTALSGEPDPPCGWLDMESEANRKAGSYLSHPGRYVTHLTVDGSLP